MACIDPKSKILQQEHIDQINKEHENLFVEGISFSEQRAIVKSISSMLYRQALEKDTPEYKLDVRDTKEQILNYLISETKNLQELIDFYKDLGTPVAEQMLFNIQQTLEKFGAIEANLDTLVRHAQTILKSLAGMKFTEHDESLDFMAIVDDNIDEDSTEEDSEGITRTSFYENFYFQLNPKDTAQNKLKKFLSFIPAYEYTETGEKVSVQTIIGTQAYVDMNIVMDNVQDILVGTKPSEEVILDKLERAAKAINKFKNTKKAWLQDLIDYYKNSPKDLRKQFISQMTRHKIRMSFVNINSYKKEGKLVYAVNLMEDNSGDLSYKILRQWKDSLKESALVSSGVVNGDVLDRIKTQFENLQKGVESNLSVDTQLFNILSSIGIFVDKKFLQEFVNEDTKLRVNNAYITFEDFLNSKNPLSFALNKLENGMDATNVGIMTEGFVRGFAEGSAKYVQDVPSSSFRVGEKTIYVYSMNQYLINRIRDLSDSQSTLREQLHSTLFANQSAYLDLLTQNEEFKEWFDYGYVSLEPVKFKSDKRSDKIDKIAEIDYEVTKLAFFNSAGIYSDTAIKGHTVSARKSKFFFLTTSDKPRMMTVNGIAVQATLKDGSLSNSAIDIMYNTVIQAELDRINAGNKTGFKEAANLSTYKTGMFYIFPQLNDLNVTINEQEVALLELAKESPILPSEAIEKVKQQIREYLTAEIDSKLASWKELGIIGKNGEINYINILDNSNKTPKTSRDIAADFVYNYALFNANMFQLVTGDPAQFFKTDVQETYNNITKRLAGEIAPRLESEGPDYIEVFANDIKVKSSNYEYLKEAFGEEIAKPYLEMNSTDAQEYTTYKTHLTDLLSYGRITQEEYDEAFKAFLEEKLPAKEIFKKVLQPLKPVYNGNDFQVIGNNDYIIDVKRYIKSSSFPLIPYYTKNKQIDRLRKEMEDLENNRGKYAGKNPNKLGVKLTYRSAVKVGFPSNVLTLAKNSKGDFVDDIDLNGKFAILKREHVGIQQDKQYDPKKNTVGVGTQDKKLLFADYDNPALEETYNALYRELYLHGLNELKKELKQKGNDVSVKELSKILIRDLEGKGETSKPLFDGLRIDEVTKDFEIPLWLTPYAKDYASLIKSMVSRAVVKHKFKGKSLILGSPAGFGPEIIEGEEGKKFMEQEKDMIFFDSYDPEKGLQGQRVENGVVKGAQILIPFPYMDNKGNKLNPKDFLTDGKFDANKLPTELRDAFSFRIPTQLRGSTSYVEIVGFIPEIHGDLVIAPADFTIQMGSDFDVDTLYNYFYETKYDETTGKLEKIKYAKKGTVSNEEYVAGIKNAILDVHIQVLKDKKVQKQVAAELGFGTHREQIKKIEEARSTKQTIVSIIFESYQTKKFYDGTAGKAGIGMFSLDSVFNALAQRKGLILHVLKFLPDGSKVRVPLTVKFGNKYNDSVGDLSRIYSLKKNSDRLGTSIIAADQNLSVDNANEQGMHVINLNTHTFTVKSLLNFLKYEEDISDMFISQPIIVDYVKAIRNNKSIIKGKKSEKKVIEDLKKKYLNTDTKNAIKYVEAADNKLADFDGVDASAVMLSMIKNQEQHPDYALNQVAILNKFLVLKEAEKPLSAIKSLLNLDSKGFDPNMSTNQVKLDIVNELKDSLVENADRLIGEYITDADGKLRILPTTLAGFDNIYGNKYMLDTFSNYFLDSNSKLKFPQIVGELQTYLGRNLSKKELVKLKTDYTNYLLSNIKSIDIDALRSELLLSTAPGSLYDNLLKLEGTTFKTDNTFLNNLNIQFTNDVILINHNNASSNDDLDTAMYESFVNLFKQSEPINGVLPYQLAEQLILYSLLKGGNIFQQFIKFIPITALKAVLSIPTENYNIDVFTEQWMRHNLLEAPTIDELYKEGPDGELQETFTVINSYIIDLNSFKGKFVYIPSTGNVKEGLYKQSAKGSTKYIRLNELGKEGTTEYTPYNKKDSIFKENNSGIQYKYKVTKNPLDVTYNQDNIENVEVPIQEPIPVKQPIKERLNFTSGKALLESIASLSNEFPEYAKYASVLNELLNIDIEIQFKEGISSYFKNTIYLNKDKDGMDLLRTIMHEMLHALTVPVLLAYSNEATLPANVIKAITNLRTFQKGVIENIIKDSTKRDKLYSSIISKAYKILEQNNGNIEATKKYITDTYFKKTTPDIIRAVFSNVIAYIEDKTAGLDPKFLSLMERYNNGEIVNTIEEEQLYYSLYNLYEFVAVAGSSKKTRDLMLQETNGTYLDKIKEFFEKILEFLGITEGNHRAMLDDIFTISKPEVSEEVKEMKSSTISIQETQSTKLYRQQVLEQSKNNIEVSNQKYTRQSVENDLDTMYIFTDNAERTSSPYSTTENVDKNTWYYKKYKPQTNKPIHYGTLNNPTSAVIRGLNNAYPISTMSAYGTNWTNNNFELFKQTIDDEINQIKKDLHKFSKLKIGNYRIGQGGLKAKLPIQHQNYLDNKLKELGIDNTQVVPKINKQSTPIQETQSTKAEQIYNKLTKGDNVRIESYETIKDEKEPFLRAYGIITHVISTRIRNSNEHFGNPFSSDEKVLSQNPSLIKTNSTKESVEKYIDWVINSIDSRAEWIRQQLKDGGLQDKPILYTNTQAQKSGAITHADALDYLINKYDWNSPSQNVSKQDIQEELFVDTNKGITTYYKVNINENNEVVSFEYRNNSNTEWKSIIDKKDMVKHTNTLRNLVNTSPERTKRVSGEGMFLDFDFPTTVVKNRNEIEYSLRAITILQSDKAKQIFIKGNKNNWDLNKILTELAIPKEQKQLLLDLDIKDREQLIIELASKYSYSVEVNTANVINKKETGSTNYDTNNFELAGWNYQSYNNNYNKQYTDSGDWVAITKEEFEDKKIKANKEEYTNIPTQYYSNLTVPGGTNYTENEISTPLITPSIKGHAQFSTDNGIGWFRSDEQATLNNKYPTSFTSGTETWTRKNGIWHSKDEYGESKRDDLTDNDVLAIYENQYGNRDYKADMITDSKTRRILEVQSDLFQKGRDKEELVSKKIQIYDQFRLDGVTYKIQDNIFYKHEVGKKQEEITEKEFKEKQKLILQKSENQFLQLLNKDNNWVTFFVKSIIQDSAKQTITEVQESDVEAKVRELENEGLLEIDCTGKLKAENGLSTSFTKGGKWKVIKDLKGYPTHEEGGVDLTIGKDGVGIKNGNTQFTAKHGLVLPREEDPILTSIYKKYPAFKNMGNVVLKADRAFTRDKTQAGDIEFFNSDNLENNTITYNNGYKVKNPNPNGFGIIYNPDNNNEQSIMLDMLHGMTKDKVYAKHREEFSNAFMGSKYAEDFKREWGQYNKETNGKNDGEQQFRDNWIDGNIRNLMFEGTDEDFKKARYWKDAKKEYLQDENINRTFGQLNNYLQIGKGYMLPEVTITANKINNK